MAVAYAILSAAYALFAGQFISPHAAYLLSGGAAILGGLSLNLFRYRRERPFNSPLSLFGASPVRNHGAGMVRRHRHSLAGSRLLLHDCVRWHGFFVAGYCLAFELGAAIGYLVTWAWSPR